MAEHGATVTWHLAPRAEFTVENYNRDHEWTFPGGEVVQASASTDFNGTASRVSPEEALIASTSSCHMLTFLALAAKKGYRVLSYVDNPVGSLGRNERDEQAITDVTLRPRVVFAEETPISEDDFHTLHQDARALCFVANTLNAKITLDPVLPRLD